MRVKKSHLARARMCHYIYTLYIKDGSYFGVDSLISLMLNKSHFLYKSALIERLFLFVVYTIYTCIHLYTQQLFSLVAFCVPSRWSFKDVLFVTFFSLARSFKPVLLHKFFFISSHSLFLLFHDPPLDG